MSDIHSLMLFTNKYKLNFHSEGVLFENMNVNEHLYTDDALLSVKKPNDLE